MALKVPPFFTHRATHTILIHRLIFTHPLQTCLLGSLKPPGHAESSDGGAPSGSVDIESGDGDSITLYLDIPFFGTMVTYTFGMQPVEREEVDILKAQLHDAQEEITILGIEVAELKRCKALQPVLISLRSSTECTEGQFVAWDTHEHNTDEGVFRRSEDTKTITVLQGGFFQVSVRLTDSSRGTHRKTSLFINGGEVAACHIGEANGYNKSATINDVFLLDNDANLQVHHTSNTPSNADVKTNNFTIIKL